MQKVGDFVQELHKKYFNYSGSSYEESEFNLILDEMNRINLERPKEDRIHFPRAEVKSRNDMTNT